MAESMAHQSTNHFWQSVKQVKTGKTALPSCIDDSYGHENISNLFLEKYKNLYNSVSYNINEMELFKSNVELEINKTCQQGNCYSNHSVTVNEIVSAIKQLKYGKSDGRLGHCTDHLIFSCHLLSVYLSLLFTLMLKYSFVPRGTLIPIPKSKKNP